MNRMNRIFARILRRAGPPMTCVPWWHSLLSRNLHRSSPTWLKQALITDDDKVYSYKLYPYLLSSEYCSAIIAYIIVSSSKFSALGQEYNIRQEAG